MLILFAFCKKKEITKKKKHTQEMLKRRRSRKKTINKVSEYIQLKKKLIKK